jgi:hypothetical protein
LYNQQFRSLQEWNRLIVVFYLGDQQVKSAKAEHGNRRPPQRGHCFTGRGALIAGCGHFVVQLHGTIWSLYFPLP